MKVAERDIIRLINKPSGGDAMPTNRENRLKIQKRYDEKHRDSYKTYLIKLNKGTEKDIIDFLEAVPNKQGFIKDLIREYMRSGK